MISSEQEEELESLGYLYTEEELIIQNRDPVHIQVRVSSEIENGGSPIKALLDLSWGNNYPHEKPAIQIVSMDIKQEERDAMVESLLQECDNCMDMAMTYVLSTALTGLLSDVHEDKLSKIHIPTIEGSNEIQDEPQLSTSQTTIRGQEQKTKAQKRREQNSWQKPGELPRGYNWVDVMSHLRKTANS
ncbi:hypothetical protein JH06_3451 [Blastocystis sp. subtype 4]|uniref:hypothetical protein n=1 Tax=Blastocystis sp. subtype 4 TaxID=944170 RepID=UPI00071223CA|nr:hypothetical protein JH06_3451 [Blastocystis sp. subtype 4]KNB43173.1 hypothetical protein JH06_3451 [Blastocystis sp. subtype 4]|eukprot:XP_014526616.1 hypothetical protein JH06_3451 [Blastocystis sp. subtype 4]